MTVNKFTDSPTQLETVQKINEIIDNLGGGASRNIGEIVASTIPLTDAGLHLLDGALISGSGSYSAFVDYIAGLVTDYPDLFETEANWQTSVTNYGVCGKFVYDSVNNTVRLPKITGFIEGASGTATLGDLTEAGLPNITGNTCLSITDAVATGAFMSGSSGDTGSGASKTYSGYGVNFEASRSSSIYGNSNTVQPQSIKVLYYIVIATSTKTEIEVDIDEIATDLNGKADVDGSNATFPHIIASYESANSWFRIYSDGWCEQGGYSSISIAQGSTPVAFTRPFINTYINIQITPVSNVAAASYNMGSVGDVSVNGFYIYAQYSTGATHYWRASGYVSLT